jgi:hypothetical protein
MVVQMPASGCFRGNGKRHGQWQRDDTDRQARARILKTGPLSEARQARYS